MYIEAEELSEQPEKYMEYSLEELDNYPYVSKAVQNPGKQIKHPFDGDNSDAEFCKILWEKGTENIKLTFRTYQSIIDYFC
jgi:hypothetical protein